MNENLNNISKKEENLYLELGKTINELKNEINRLRGEIGDLKKLNLSLEDVNKILLNSIDKLKVEQSSVVAKFDENINKLREFVQMDFTQQSSNSSCARIPCYRPMGLSVGLCILAHSAEFKCSKFIATFA